MYPGNERVIWVEIIQRRIQDGFSILIPVADALQMFGENPKLSRITAVPQAHPQLRLILIIMEKPDKGTPSVNDNIDRELPRSRNSLEEPSIISSRQSGRLTQSTIPYRLKK